MRARARKTGSRCSIFSFDVGANKALLPLARNTLRNCARCATRALLSARHGRGALSRWWAR